MPETRRRGARRWRSAPSRPATRALKLGWGPLGADLDRDEELIGRPRARRSAPTATLMIDGGMGYSVKRALAAAGAGSTTSTSTGSRSRSRPTTTTATGGSARASPCGSPPARPTPASGRSARSSSAGDVDVLQPDLARCGGFTVARQIAALAPRDRRRGRAALLLDRRAGRGVAALRRRARAPDAVGVLGRGLTARRRAAARSRSSCATASLAVPAGPGLGITLNDELIERMRFDG